MGQTTDPEKVLDELDEELDELDEESDGLDEKSNEPDVKPAEPEEKPIESEEKPVEPDAKPVKKSTKPGVKPVKKSAKPGVKPVKKSAKPGVKPVEKPAEPDDSDEEFEEEGTGLNLFTLFGLLIATAVTVVYFFCTVKTVYVSGNSLYTSEEIAESVISDDSQLRHNTVFLTALYMTPLAPEIPFEESVRVSMEDYDTIRITVKDMDIAGYIPYGGKNLYFSSDGIVLENSALTIRNATFVTGLSITKGEIGSRMEAEDEAGLNLVLSALENLKKYDLKADCVVLGKTGGVIMYLDEVKVQLGRTDYELKISKLSQIYPYLEGRSGTINMTNYSSADENIILK